MNKERYIVQTAMIPGDAVTEHIGSVWLAELADARVLMAEQLKKTDAPYVWIHCPDGRAEQWERADAETRAPRFVRYEL